VIDLHLHTTASDGRSSPEELVGEAVAAGVSTIAVTDHDTMAALPALWLSARAADLTCVPGIEITAVHAGRDVHILGYFLDPAYDELERFLLRQRADRRLRVLEMAARLDRLGAPIDMGPLLAEASRESGRTVGRPMVAVALVEGGHARDVADAFERFLSEGKPAFVERLGTPPDEVIGLVARAGGLTSLAHPGKLGLDAVIPGLVDAGLSAIEVYHPDHQDSDIERYRELAQTYSLLVTGGSDYHGRGDGRTDGLGRIGLPEDDYARLIERSGWRDRSYD
jgi:predicted metal-dependent phosphoesterase TrpH